MIVVKCPFLNSIRSRNNKIVSLFWIDCYLNFKIILINLLSISKFVHSFINKFTVVLCYGFGLSLGWLNRSYWKIWSDLFNMKIFKIKHSAPIILLVWIVWRKNVSKNDFFFSKTRWRNQWLAVYMTVNYISAWS